MRQRSHKLTSQKRKRLLPCRSGRAGRERWTKPRGDFPRLRFGLVFGFLSTVWCCDAAVAEPPLGAKSAHVPAAGQSLAGGEWEILFDEGTTQDEYARQIDFFKIEIAAVSKNGKVEYISHVAEPKPDKRTGRVETDYRFRIGWKKGTLHAFDRKLLAKAGIASDRKEMMHYFPIDVQTEMARLERDYAEHEPSEIKRTRFQIRPRERGKGYEFVVIEQDPPKKK